MKREWTKDKRLWVECEMKVPLAKAKQQASRRSVYQRWTWLEGLLELKSTWVSVRSGEAERVSQDKQDHTHAKRMKVQTHMLSPHLRDYDIRMG